MQRAVDALDRHRCAELQCRPRDGSDLEHGVRARESLVPAQRCLTARRQQHADRRRDPEPQLQPLLAGEDGAQPACQHGVASFWLPQRVHEREVAFGADLALRPRVEPEVELGAGVVRRDARGEVEQRGEQMAAPRRELKLEPRAIEQQRVELAGVIGRPQAEHEPTGRVAE